MSGDFTAEQLAFDPVAELVNSFYYNRAIEEAVESCEEEDVELYDLYDDHILSQADSPFGYDDYEDIESIMHDSVNIADLEAKLEARLSSITIKLSDFERASSPSAGSPDLDDSESVQDEDEDCHQLNDVKEND